VLAVLSVLGGILVFDITTTALGQTFQWYRYFIAMIPLSLLCLGIWLADAGRVAAIDALTSPPVSQPLHARLKGFASFALPVVVIAAMVVPGYVATLIGMVTPSIGREDTPQIEALLHPGSKGAVKHELDATRHLASDIDAMHLPDGSILVDSFIQCAEFAMLEMKQPKVLVVTSDRDFQPALQDPPDFHVTYLMTNDPHSADGALNAVNEAYPTLYADGGGFATLTKDWPASDDCPEFRLYRVNGQASVPEVAAPHS